MNKPLTLTSSTHAFAYATYGKQTALGILLALGVVASESLDKLVVLPALGIIMFGAGAVGLYSIGRAPRLANPEPAMRLEMFACIAMAAINTFFVTALFLLWPGATAATTKVYVAGVATGCLVRVWQLNRDRKRLRKALRMPLPADANTLADPTDKD